MKKLKYTLCLLLTVTFMPVTKAVAVEETSIKEFPEQPVFEKEDKGFSYGLAEDADEEITLQLFVKDTASERATYDISADDLNRIAPAAGIKIKFGF